MNNHIFELPNKQDKEVFIDEFRKEFHCFEQNTNNYEATFFDTFDWRLYNKSLICNFSNKTFSLIDISTMEYIYQQTTEKIPVLVNQIKDKKLKSILSPVITIRALIEVGTFSVSESFFNLLNEDEKTVCRIKMLVYNKNAKRNIETVAIEIETVRGYAKEAGKVSKYLENKQLNAINKNQWFAKLLHLSGRTPGAYSSKFNPELSFDMPAVLATQKLLSDLFKTIEINEKYIKKDIDTEFLHDFRVAIRRSRSAISQLKDVFTPEITLQLKEKYAYIGKFTNELRDFDVYLLHEEEYKAMVPDNLQQGIDYLFDYFAQQRKCAFKNVTSELRTEKYKNTKREINELLKMKSDEIRSLNGELPIGVLAQQRIFNSFKRIAKRGTKILKTHEDEKMHELRIDCKKLRYLLEFFISIFPESDVKILIKQLKKLQDVLGRFNDVCMQELYLNEISHELKTTPEKSVDAMLAVGVLIGAFHSERDILKQKFDGVFNAFMSNKPNFNGLFASNSINDKMENK